MESSCRDLSSDMAEHRPILRNNQNTYYPRFSFRAAPTNAKFQNRQHRTRQHQ